MKKLLGLLLSLTLASLLHALPAGVASVPFSTSQAQFTGGDLITIQDVLATSPNLGIGDTVVVRGTYTLASRASGFLQIQLSTNAGTPPISYNPPRLNITAGSGTFELEYAGIQQVGSLHVTFYPGTGGSSFGGIYFAPPSAPGTPTTPTTPVVSTPPVNTTGVSVVPFATSRAQFAAGDSLTITQVLATSPAIGPGDVVLVRGTYTLASSATALLAISLTANAPGAREAVAPNSRLPINAGSGSFELAYEIKQPGSMHLSFYPGGEGGSSFGGVYFAAPGATGAPTGTTAALVSPATNTGLLGNLSIRSQVGPGDGALIAGVTVTDRERYVLIRAVGPTLSAFGVANTLRKPQLSVYDTAGNLVASAGSWTTNFSAAQRAGIALLSTSVGAFALNAGSDDAVLHLRLVPGGYTITVSTGDGQTGTALMEVYASSTFTLPTSN